jgi:hypothetical protein
MQTWYAHEQTEKAYKDFIDQFDSRTDEDVRWTPYTEVAVTARTPQGLSSLCFRDRHY